MSELVMPVDGLVKAMSVTGKYTAKHYYGIENGWCGGHNTDAWAMTNLLEPRKRVLSGATGTWEVPGLYKPYGITTITPAIRNIYARQPIH